MDMQCPIMILAEIEISGSTDFQNRAVITQAATPCLMTAGETATAAIELKNTGSNDISSITVSCAQEGKEVWSEDFPLPQDISKNTAAIMTVPVNVSDKGDVTLSISKINGEPNGEKSEYKFSPLVISKDISSRYTRRPLVEYVVSESNYRSVGYDEEIVTPGLDRYIDRVTRINWHCDDQFQLGLADDRDYVLDLLIDMAEGDKMKVYIPTLMLDRSMNLGISPSYCLFNFSNPMMGVLYSPGAEDSYEYALAQPTFASVDVTFDVAGSQAKINVSGEADLSVLPENEQMMMTVVLVEDGIESDSQEYPGGDGESSNPGHAVHNYLVRQCLTGINGQPVEMNGNKFSKSFSTELDYDNVPSKMRAVAFLHRNVKNSNWERTVINSAESVASGSGIDAVEYTENNLRPIVADNRIIAPVGSQMSVYAASGVEVSPESLGAGIYIVKVKSGERNASFKVYVK